MPRSGLQPECACAPKLRRQSRKHGYYYTNRLDLFFDFLIIVRLSINSLFNNTFGRLLDTVTLLSKRVEIGTLKSYICLAVTCQ